MILSDFIDFNPKRPLEKGVAAPFVEMADLQESERDIRQIGSRVFSGGGSKFSNGDTLFARITPCLENGKTAKASGLPKDTVGHGSTEFIVMAAKDRSIDEDFVYYLARLPEFRIFAKSRMEGTSGRQRVSWQALADFEIADIDESRRKQIGEILASLDNRITALRGVNKTLDEMARTLFKDWFVDFGPVRAKISGNRPPHLSADVAALFPDTLDQQQIPSGWKSVPLDQLADFLNGLALQKYPGTGVDDLPVIKIAELRSGINANSGRASSSIPQKYVVHDGDIIFSWSGSLVQKIWAGGRGALNQHLFKVTSEHYPKWLHYYWVDYHLPAFQAIAASKATTMGHIQRHHLTEAKAIIGDDAVMQMADSLIAPIFGQIVANATECRTLALLRDCLIPKLYSGEWAPSHATEAVGDVA